MAGNLTQKWNKIQRGSTSKAATPTPPDVATTTTCFTAENYQIIFTLSRKSRREVSKYMLGGGTGVGGYPGKNWLLKLLKIWTKIPLVASWDKLYDGGDITQHIPGYKLHMYFGWVLVLSSIWYGYCRGGRDSTLTTTLPLSHPMASLLVPEGAPIVHTRSYKGIGHRVRGGYRVGVTG